MRSCVSVTSGLDLPDRHGFANVVSKLPFTSKDLDPTALLERKQGLEKYIQVWRAHVILGTSTFVKSFLPPLSPSFPPLSPSLPSLPLSPFPLPPPSQSISSRPAILESALFRDFLKSGVAVLRDFNAHNLHKSRKRKLLGIMKGHSEDMEEAKVRCHMIIML